MNRAVIFAGLFALVSCSQLCQAGRVLAAQGSPKCTSACEQPILFKSVLSSNPVSYACAASTEAGQVIGYQLGDGPAICTTAVNGQVVNSTAYECLCEEPFQTQGLDLPGDTRDCADSCAQGVGGEVGMPVSAGESFACLVSTEFGKGNRFGSVKRNTGGTCSYVLDGAVREDSSFSCVCLFSPRGTTPSSSIHMPQDLPPVQTAG